MEMNQNTNVVCGKLNNAFRFIVKDQMIVMEVPHLNYYSLKSMLRHVNYSERFSNHSLKAVGESITSFRDFVYAIRVCLNK